MLKFDVAQNQNKQKCLEKGGGEQEAGVWEFWKQTSQFIGSITEGEQSKIRQYYLNHIVDFTSFQDLLLKLEKKNVKDMKRRDNCDNFS